MQISINKTGSLFFLLLGFAPLLFVLTLCIRERIVHHQMMEKLEQQHLQHVSVPEKEVTWVEADEVLVHERMFDIRSYTLVNGVYDITGLYDDEETRLRKQYKKAVRDSAEDQLLSHLFKWFQLSCYSQEYDLHLLHYNAESPLSFHSYSCKTGFIKILTPPPDMLHMPGFFMRSGVSA